jgi:hypothetical protein
MNIVDENIKRQESALAEIDAINKKFKNGDLSAEQANIQTVAVMQALERDTAGQAEEIKKYWARRRLKTYLIFFLMLLVPLVFIAAFVIWRLQK